MKTTLNYIVMLAVAACLLTCSTFAVTKTQKAKSDPKRKTTDSIAQIEQKKKVEEKKATPAKPVVKDSTAGTKKLVPGKVNDFEDKNKNGIDDRLEKQLTGKSKKPAKAKATDSKTKPNSMNGETKKNSKQTAQESVSKKSK